MFGWRGKADIFSLSRSTRGAISRLMIALTDTSKMTFSQHTNTPEVGD